MNNNLRETIRRVNANLALSTKHPRIIMNAAGTFIYGNELMVPVDGIPASFFSRVRIRK